MVLEFGNAWEFFAHAVVNGAHPASLVLTRWHTALQFFKPVEHNINLCRALFLGLGRFNHQEALAIARHVVVRARRRCRQESSLKQNSGFAGAKACLANHIHDHQLVPDPIKQFPSIGIPHGLGATIR